MAGGFTSPHQAGWTPERVEVLVRLWGEGKSAGEIARILAGGVTRNACISKVHRLGLSRIETADRPDPSGHKQAQRLRRRLGRRDVIVEPDPNRLPPTPPPPDPVIPLEPLMVDLVGLAANGCKYPIGGPEPVQLFCGHPRDGDRPYCRPHAKAAFQPPKPGQSKADLARQLRRYI